MIAPPPPFERPWAFGQDVAGALSGSLHVRSLEPVQSQAAWGKTPAAFHAFSVNQRGA